MTNKLPDPSNGESQQSEFSAEDQDASIERLTEHMLTIDKLTEVLATARDMDQALRDPNMYHHLSRRFVMDVPGKATQYPFVHDRLILRLRSGAKRPMNLEGMALRYAKGLDPQNFEFGFNGAILITIGVGRGQSVECLLSGAEWASVADASSLWIEEGELLGLQGPIEEPPFGVAELRDALQYFEPELQDNSTPPRA